MLAGGNPVLLSVWVNLEDMSSGAEDRLFPEGQKVKSHEHDWDVILLRQVIYQLCPVGCKYFTLLKKVLRKEKNHVLMYSADRLL